MVTFTTFQQTRWAQTARQLGERTKRVRFLPTHASLKSTRTCIPVHGDHQSKLTLMSESLRNDGRVWVPKNKDDKRKPQDIPEEERDYYLERIYPSFGNLVPRDVASRNAKAQVDQGKGVGSTGVAVYFRLQRCY